AVLVFVDRSVPRAGLPAELDGVRTRVVEGDGFAPSGVVTAEASAALERMAAPAKFVSPISEAEVGRARVVHEGYADELMRRPDVEAVGITSSADSPGEAALLIVVVRGMTHGSIPAAIGGVRTRVRETGRFHAK
ncbi:MAG TPA: hypothetical protein VEG35_05065, partial [Burkholderiales bacterium]|nr:hypothetical protein [Burkholderiales bacterium]